VYSTLQLASLLQELVYAVDALCVMLVRTQLNAVVNGYCQLAIRGLFFHIVDCLVKFQWFNE